MQLSDIQNPFIQTYLKYSDDTESPEIFHVWAALSGLSACLARRVWLPLGELGEIYPNTYILLVGPPAVRKSSAVSMMQRNLRKATNVRFGAADIAGQRQGLIAQMAGLDTDEEKLENSEKEQLNSIGIHNLGVEALESFEYAEVVPEDKKALFICASEFTSFAGTQSKELVTFLTDLWDNPDEYVYRLKTSELKLEDPCLNLIGGTTPTMISDSLPTIAIGGGFTSRVILVHAHTKKRKIARPKKADEALATHVRSIYALAYNDLQGQMTETVDAAAFVDAQYDKDLGLEDPRLAHYQQRRQTHLMKLGMLMAAGRGSMEINFQDYHDAELLLTLTEVGMSDALGEHGLSTQAMARQRLVEIVQSQKEPLSDVALWALMSKDMRKIDFLTYVNELITAGKLVEVKLQGSGWNLRGLMWVHKKTNDDIFAHLLTEGQTREDLVV